jgi:hypothetical protein
MSWNPIAAADVQNEILPDEVAILNTIQGANTILATVLAKTVNKVRSQILVGGSQLDAAGTIPDQLWEEVIAIARWRWFSSLPNTDLCSKQRQAQYDEAISTMKDIARGKDEEGRPVKVELPNPATALALPGPAGQMQAQGGRRKASQHKMNGAL